MKADCDTDLAAIEAFLDAIWMERGLSANTLAAYRADLSGFAAWLAAQGKTLICAGPEDLSAYMATRKHVRSMARLLSCLRRFYQHLVREGRLDADPSARIDAPKLGRPLPKSLTETEVEALLDAPAVEDVLGLRDRAMLELLYASGLRVSELVSAGVAQVNLNQGVVRITGKGGKQCLVPIG